VKILIVCSGNAPNNELFDLELHHAFIYEQVSALKKLNITFDFFYIKEKGVYGYLKSILQLRKKISTSDFDIVHAHYGLSALVAIFQRKLPLVATFHGSDVNYNMLNLLSSFVVLFSKVNIFVSEDLKNKIFIKSKKNVVIPCGIDLNQFIPIQKAEARTKLKLDHFKKYILFPSAKETLVKNYSLAKQVVDRLPDVILLELSGKTRRDVNFIMNACDVLLMTSLREGSPQTIKEAMACNCPIVSTDVGDVKKAIKDIPGCYITSFNLTDVTDKLSKALDFAQSNGRTSGRERLIKLNLDNEGIAKMIYEVYKRVLNGEV